MIARHCRLSVKPIIADHCESVAITEHSHPLALAGSVDGEDAGSGRLGGCPHGVSDSMIGLRDQLEFGARDCLRTQERKFRCGSTEERGRGTVDEQGGSCKLMRTTRRIGGSGAVSEPMTFYARNCARAARCFRRTGCGIRHPCDHRRAPIYVHRDHGCRVSAAAGRAEAYLMGTQLTAARGPVEFAAVGVKNCSCWQRFGRRESRSGIRCGNAETNVVSVFDELIVGDTNSQRRVGLSRDRIGYQVASRQGPDRNSSGCCCRGIHLKLDSRLTGARGDSGRKPYRGIRACKL